MLEPNINAWRRDTVGDLTSTLRLQDQGGANRPFPTLPDAQSLYDRQLAAANSLPPSTPPLTQSMPSQEPGGRPHTG